MRRRLMVLAVIGVMLGCSPAALAQDQVQGQVPTEPLPVPAPIMNQYTVGVVLDVDEKSPVKRGEGILPFGETQVVQEVTVRVSSGPLAGNVYTTENVLGANPAFNINVERGDRVVLNVESAPDLGTRVYIADRERMSVVGVIVGLFILAVIILGGRQLIKRLSILFLFALLFTRLLLPAITQNVFPLPLFLVLAGVCAYSWEAADGRPVRRSLTVTGLTLAGLLLMMVLYAGAMALEGLSGFATESMSSLWFLYPEMNFRLPLLLSLLLSHFGAVYWLVRRLIDECGECRDYAACMAAGRQLLGPLLAVVLLMDLGLAVPFLLPVRELPPLKFFNLESTAAYLTLVFTGALSLMLMLPLTGAWLGKNRRGETS